MRSCRGCPSRKQVLGSSARGQQIRDVKGVGGRCWPVPEDLEAGTGSHWPPAEEGEVLGRVWIGLCSRVAQEQSGAGNSRDAAVSRLSALQSPDRSRSQSKGCFGPVHGGLGLLFWACSGQHVMADFMVIQGAERRKGRGPQAPLQGTQ